MYRQGDVLIVPAAIPIGEELKQIERENGNIVLAHGEATGHTHAIKSENAGLFAANDKVFLMVLRSVDLVHEEHSTIKIPAGNYRVIRQREYSPEEIRYVAD